MYFFIEHIQELSRWSARLVIHLKEHITFNWKRLNEDYCRDDCCFVDDAKLRHWSRYFIGQLNGVLTNVFIFRNVLWRKKSVVCSVMYWFFKYETFRIISKNITRKGVNIQKLNHPNVWSFVAGYSFYSCIMNHRRVLKDVTPNNRLTSRSLAPTKYLKF